MLRLIPKLVAGLLALILLLIGVIAVALPRLINTEEFRVAMSETVAGAIGTPIEWTSLEVGLFPLRLIVQEPVLLAESVDREAASLSAQSVDLRLSKRAILARRIEVDSLVLRGVELVVTRTADGFVLPLQDEPAKEESEAAPAPPDPPPGEASKEFELAVRRFALADSRLIIHDQTLPRSIEWRFEDLRFEAKGDSLSDPLAVDLSARMASGEREVGGLSISGEAALSGEFDLAVELDSLLLQEIQPYVSDATLAGALSGRVEITGAGQKIARIATDVRVEDMAITTYGLDLVGRLDLEAEQIEQDPVRFVAKLDLGPRGKAKIDGTTTLEGAVAAKLDLEGLDLEPFAQLAGQEMQISGRATGRVDLATRPGEGLSRLSTDLAIAKARYADQAIDLTGALDLVLDLEGLGEQDPVRFDVALDLDGGGRVDAKGVATLAGAVDTKLVLDDVDLAPIAPWVPQGTTIAGRITGDADVRLTASRKVERLAAKLRIESARLVSDPIDVSGRFDLDAGLVGAGPIDLRAALLLEDGSQLQVEGTSTVEGVVDVNAQIETFDLALIKPFLPDPEMLLAGSVTGKGRVVGNVSAPEFLSLDVGVDGGVFKTTEYSVEGPFLAVAKVKEPFSRPRGSIDLDLTAARVQYLDQFVKRAGMRAELTTRFVPEESGEIVFESKLKLRDVDGILLQGAIGETTLISLTAPDFELSGWAEVFPAIAEYEAAGVVQLDGLSVELIKGAPSRFGGRISLRGIGLTVPDAGRIRLRGSIVGEETRIRTKGLRALIAGATIAIKGSVEEPLGPGIFDLEIESSGEVEVNDLMTELAAAGGTLFGPLEFKGRLEGLTGSDQAWSETIVGDLKLSVGKAGGGRLRGVSLLRTVLDQIPLLGGAARLTQPFRGGKSVDDYFTERFEIIEGEFVIGQGKLDARTLRLAYEGYEARLSGPMRLRDLWVDMTGELLLKGDLVSALGGLAGADMAEREPIRIQLAKVTNTLDDPKVVMTSETLAAVPKLLFQATGLDTITLGIGKGIKKGVDKVLEGVGSGRK